MSRCFCGLRLSSTIGLLDTEAGCSFDIPLTLLLLESPRVKLIRSLLAGLLAEASMRVDCMGDTSASRLLPGLENRVDSGIRGSFLLLMALDTRKTRWRAYLTDELWEP